MIFKNILLAFQLENYYNIRFLKFVYSHPKFWIFWSKRQTLEYTAKAKWILTLCILFFILDIFGSIYLFSGLVQILALASTLISLPLYFITANIILSPVDTYLKNKIIQKAKDIIKLYPNLKIIGITGSMWKTTTKEFLTTILSEKYKVLSTQGTKNTPLWISRLINEELSEAHEIFIVEMGAYSKGNIAELCSITKPDISIITGITLQHLERFGSIDEIIDTKFEIFEALESWSLGVIDISTPWAKKWLETKKLATDNIITVEKWVDFQYKENFWGISFELNWEKIETKILSDYIVETLQICDKVARYLWMNMQEFKNQVSKLNFVEHRMQLIYNPQSKVYVIDDSFNWNIEWIKSILHLVNNAPFRWRKILIAAWVVELWEESEKVNTQIWNDIAMSKVDMVLLVSWPIGKALLAGLKDSGYPESQIKIYKTPLELHDDLKNITQNWDAIIFQSDLSDNYL